LIHLGIGQPDLVPDQVGQLTEVYVCSPSRMRVSRGHRKVSGRMGKSSGASRQAKDAAKLRGS
jgi:hypothetical protein